jgi:hypothetical protein
MSEFYKVIINELNALWGAEPIENMENTFVVTTNNGMQIFIELYGEPEYMLIGCNICELPENVTRSLWLKEALRWNGDRNSGEGVFSYNSDSGMLALHLFMQLDTLDAQQLNEKIWLIDDKAKIWSDAFQSGHPPILSGAGAILEGSSSSQFMGLRP